MMMLDNDKIEQIEHRVQNAGLGYDTGTLARSYAKDVKALLDDRKELMVKVKAADERADLWQRDCEAATLRVRELELQHQAEVTIITDLSPLITTEERHP